MTDQQYFWAGDKLSLLTDLWDAQVPTKAIAQVFGVTARAIGAAASRQGLPARTGRCLKGFNRHDPRPLSQIIEAILNQHRKTQNPWKAAARRAA
jgi:hypothetical protein